MFGALLFLLIFIYNDEVILQSFKMMLQQIPEAVFWRSVLLF